MYQIKNIKYHVSTINLGYLYQVVKLIFYIKVISGTFKYIAT